jgi:hypothetical protein
MPHNVLPDRQRHDTPCALREIPLSTTSDHSAVCIVAVLPNLPGRRSAGA